MSCSKCPICHESLNIFPCLGHNLYRCNNHHGFLVETELVTKVLSKETVDQLQKLKPMQSPLFCCECKARMALYSARTQKNYLQCYSCEPCSYLWFLQQDLNSVLLEATNQSWSSSKKDPIELEDLRLSEVEVFWGLMRKRGLPVANSVPYVCLAIIIISGFFVFKSADLSSQGLNSSPWAFNPSEPFLRGGLPALTSVFVHVSWGSLLMNSFFLYLFGEDVEDTLGTTSFLLLVLLSIVFSKLLVVFFNVNSSLPTVGMGAIVSGVLGYFCFKFTEAQISLPFSRLRPRMGHRVWLTAPLYGLIFFASLAYTVALKQKVSTSIISQLSNLGGFMAGALYFLFIDSGKSK